MDVITTDNGRIRTFTISGRLDTLTAPELEPVLLEAVGGFELVTLDFTALSYLSSAGLRVLLIAHKKAAATGHRLELTGISEGIANVFETIGLSGILNIV
jgi:anti-sigma B factor antagonist